MTPAWRVAHQPKNALTETREDYPEQGAAMARAEALRQQGRDVVVYRIDLEESA